MNNSVLHNLLLNITHSAIVTRKTIVKIENLELWALGGEKIKKNTVEKFWPLFKGLILSVYHLLKTELRLVIQLLVNCFHV